MKVELITFAHSGNGLSLCVIPESDVEERLLKGIWQHGKLERTNHVSSTRYAAEYCVKWDLRKSREDGDD